MDLGEFDFEFDESLIALRPLAARASARLLVQEGDLRHHATVGDLPAFLRPGDMLVFNDTKVIPARLFGKRKRPDAEAKVEITLIRETGPGQWQALAKPRRKLRAGDVITFSPALTAEVMDLSTQAQVALAFNLSGPDFHVALQEAGVMPLPPYIAARRAADAADAQDYQPVFAAREGAIAAPTASLHFDEALLGRLESAGVQSCFVTLHVGIGTFLPVKVQRIEDHVMHAEWGEITPQAAAAINAAKARGGRIIPVGTTALRLIESAGRDGRVAPWEGETDIFITPGFAFKVADGLMTNFHLPKSTLMVLVSALMGIDQIRDIYADAIARRYRFFSYGDASLLLPRRG